MSNSPYSRRGFVKNTIKASALVTLPSLLYAQPQQAAEKKKIVVVGGHPDDPESGTGGTIPLLVKAGHEVTLMYFTNGDEGIAGKTHEQASAIRKKEALEACKVLNTKPLFVNQVDGESIITNAEMNRFQKLLWAEKPHIVFTHWPIDSHKDHQLASVLTIQAWNEAPQPFTLYFYEVCTGTQTFVFHPTDYVDISDTQALKYKALACHSSQDLIGKDGKYSQGMYDCGHPAMEDFRGKELGVRAAEGFIRMTGKGMGKLII
jgi:LmbE family N-acetylglucosaminyl deacetylase